MAHASGSEAVALIYELCHPNGVLRQERAEHVTAPGKQVLKLLPAPIIARALKHEVPRILNCRPLAVGANPLLPG